MEIQEKLTTPRAQAPDPLGHPARPGPAQAVGEAVPVESGWEVPALRGWASLAPGPHLLEPGPSSTTSYSGPSPSLTPPSPWRPFAPPLLPLPVSFSLPSILKQGRTRPSFPTGDTPRLSSNFGREPSRSLEPPLTSRVPACVCGGRGEVNLGMVAERDWEITSWQAPMGRGGAVC